MQGALWSPHLGMPLNPRLGMLREPGFLGTSDSRGPGHGDWGNESCKHSSWPPAWGGAWATSPTTAPRPWSRCTGARCSIGASEALVDHEVDRIVIVVGYHAQGVRDAVGDDYRGTPVTYVENVDYATTNNIHSLYLAADELAKDDTLLLESDLIYEPRIIERLLQHPAPNVVAVEAYQPWMDGTMVTLGPDHVIQAFVPTHLVDGQAMDQYFKTVNIYKLSQDFIENRYLPFLEAYVRSVGADEYYEQVLRVIAGLDNHGARRHAGGGRALVRDR